MMRIRVGWSVLGLLFGMVAARGADAPTPSARKAPADFKLVVALHGVGKEAIGGAELVAQRGLVYQFNSDAPREVIVHDPFTERVELLDMGRMVQAEITWQALDASRDRIARAIASAIAKREEEGGRANRVAASMSRDLLEPRFAASFDPKTNHLRLSNPTVEVEADGAPEPDAARLKLVAGTLASAIKLDAARNPQQIPPFARLETLRALTDGHHLRPTETSFLFRLAGPPRRLRWTYRLVPELTPREREALARINRLRAKAARVRYEEYRAAEEEGGGKKAEEREQRTNDR